jgi:hypothetical protein
VVSLCFPALSQAGELDGIYRVPQETGYILIYQTGATVVAVELEPTSTDGTNIQGSWQSTKIGTLAGRTVTMNTSDHVHTQTSYWAFGTDGSITVTTPTCTPAAGYAGTDACDMLGQTYILNKMM